jgi:hypothetical protein
MVFVCKPACAAIVEAARQDLESCAPIYCDARFTPPPIRYNAQHEQIRMQPTFVLTAPAPRLPSPSRPGRSAYQPEWLDLAPIF